MPANTAQPTFVDFRLVFSSTGAQLWNSFLHLMCDRAEGAEISRQSTEEAEIDASQSGDQQAYEQLVRRHQQQIGKLLWRFTKDPTEHEELVHVVFVEAWVSLSKYRSEGAFAAWLATIATRVGYAFWKRQARIRDRNEVSIEIIEEPTGSVASDVQEEYEQVERALANLSPRDRLVLTLLYLEEHSVAETAQLTGWTQSMVKVQAHRARERLKKLLGIKDE